MWAIVGSAKVWFYPRDVMLAPYMLAPYML